MTGMRETPKISPKMVKNQPFFDYFDFLKTVHMIRMNFSTVFLNHIRVQYVEWHQNCISRM